MIVHDPESIAAENHPKYPRFWRVPPLPSASLMDTVGAPSIENFYVVGEAWALIVSSLSPQGAAILDIGCGCGRTARLLLARPDVRYVGFDVSRTSIEWCSREISPLAGGRFQFVHLDVHSGHYNPNSTTPASQARFPAADGTVDIAFAASLFTHLLEPDARRYLAEASRCLAKGGLLIASIHDEVPAGESFSGNEARVDVSRDYFVRMASDAALELRESIGLVCGQPTLIFAKR